MSIGHYLVLSGLLFTIGAAGVFVRRNLITLLLSVEIMLNAANINLVAFSHYLQSMAGQMVALFNIAIAAGEAVEGAEDVSEPLHLRRSERRQARQYERQRRDLPPGMVENEQGMTARRRRNAKR